MKRELIEKLKNNWTAWGGLSEEERGFLNDNWEHVDWHNGTNWVRATCSVHVVKLGVRDILRLSTDFEEKPASKFGEDYGNWND